MNRPFKVVVDGGYYNGSHRYYSSFGRAYSFVCRYFRACEGVPERIFADIYFVHPDGKLTHLGEYVS